MTGTEQQPPRPTIAAGLGAIAFSATALVAVNVANAPGGNYSASQITTFLSHGHRIAVIVVFHLALLGLLGLVAVLAHLRDLVENRRAASILWGAGIASTACFAAGWGIICGQAVAHLEGGRAIVIPPAVTYLISEIGVVFIFGCGSLLLGVSLIVFARTAPTSLPRWLRCLTLICGVAGVAGLAFFTFFVLMLWGLAAGTWLITHARRTESSLAEPVLAQS